MNAIETDRVAIRLERNQTKSFYKELTMNNKVACIFLCCVLCTAIAKADYIRSLEFVGETTVNPGATTTVSVFFRETVTAGEPLLLNDPTWGLTTANFTITRSASTGNNDITAAVKNTIFDGTTPVTFNASTASFPLFAILNTPTGSAGTTTSSLLLGTFNVTGGAIGSVATFTFNTPAANDFILGDGAPNGPLSVGASLGTLPSFTVTSVPEPASVFLVGMAGIGGLIARRWRKRRLQVSESR